MSDLYPTPTRLALLRDIRDRRVVEDWYEGQPGDAWHDRWSAHTKVTSRIAEFRRAEWCEADPADVDLDTRFLVLTAAGERVLSEHSPNNT